MEYTPFDCLAVAETTRSGLLKCWESEIEICWVSSGELRSMGDPLVPLMVVTNPNSRSSAPDNGTTTTTIVDATKTKWVDRCADLDIIVTTHRLAFVKNEQQQQQALIHPKKMERIIRYVHLSSIFSLSTESQMFKSPKLILQCSLGELILAFPNGSDRTKRRDECHDQLKIARQRAQWETSSTTTGTTSTAGATFTNTKQQPTSRRRVGVDAILNANTRRHQQAAQLTSTAFGGDAEQLLREAADLVQIIEKYVATLDKSTLSDGRNNSDNQQLVNLLQGMGMTSALHRDDQLARQLADFLRPKFQQQQQQQNHHHSSAIFNCITLTDVYCWFNRARGSHLLSPDELLAAVKSMEALGLGISSQTFESGLVVVRLDDSDDGDTAMQSQRFFLDLCTAASATASGGQNQHGYITAVQVSQMTKVPAVLAMEQLQLAERNGILVRDETVESIRFYPNRFKEWVSSE